MPQSTCMRTFSVTCLRSVFRSDSLNGSMRSRRLMMSTISGGRTRLPTCVVNMRSVLRFMLPRSLSRRFELPFVAQEFSRRARLYVNDGRSGGAKHASDL
jgi:hypothetical protein